MRPLPSGLPQPGDVLAGAFRLERLLGAGGMGSVFAAFDLRHQIPIALKLMLPQFVSSVEFARRFDREARAAAALESRHVAHVYEVGQLPDGGLYMVMELLRGHDLARWLSLRGPLPIAEAVGHVVEACDAIAEAHARGIVHRDLKPSNLFLAEQPGGRPIVKVLDFGISKTLGGEAPDGEALTATDSALGSPQYMSPEQLRSAKNVDHRTDIWSLGVILHKLVTGALAFEADSVGAHLAMIVTDPPTPLRKRRPDAPVELEQIVLRCLQRDLSVRFQNLGQLVLALAPFAPADVRPAIERVVALVGPAARAPLPPLSAGSECPTAPGASAMTAPASPPRRGLPVGAVVAGSLLLCAALGAVAAFALRPPPAPVPAASASAPPVASAPPSAAPSAEAPSATVRVTVEIEPADAVLELDGNPVEGRALVIPRGPASHRLVARAPGYAPETRELGGREDAAVAIVLRRADAGAPRPPVRTKKRVPLETTL